MKEWAESILEIYQQCSGGLEPPTPGHPVLYQLSYVPHSIVILALLSGCASFPTGNIPVSQSCVKEAPVKPATLSEKEIIAMPDYAATLTVWTERLLLKGYAEKADAVIQACK